MGTQNDSSRAPHMQYNHPSSGIPSEVAPWMSGNGSTTPSGPGGTSFYHDSSDTQSTPSQMSPANPLSNQPRPPSSAPPPYSADLSFRDERRPSVASIATVSSQGSRASANRGGLRKLQGFFGEEFPGRDSSENSLNNSVAGRDQRARSYSHQSHGERKHSNATSTDHTREASPSSSRPRSPVPAPDVVPFLYQDNTVRLRSTPHPLLMRRARAAHSSSRLRL